MIPVTILVYFLPGVGPLKQFLGLHADELKWSLLCSAGAAGLALLVAGAAMDLARPRPGKARRWRRVQSAVIQITMLLAMFLPPAVTSCAMLKLVAALHLPAEVRMSWPVFAAGLSLRYAALAMVLLWFANISQSRQLDEMAATDGCSAAQAWWHVHLPRNWPLAAGAGALVIMLCMTEIPATSMLLPPGLPSFAQSLLNQMHYVRDEHVIAACLVLVGAYLVLLAPLVLVMRLVARRSAGTAPSSVRPTLLLAIGLCGALALGGCQSKDDSGAPKVAGCVGRTGSGQGEFIYPRAIDLAADGSLWIADKTGRIQHLTADGGFLGEIRMPLTQDGKPTGITVGPDGNVYVADTHYHRVMVYAPDGKLVREFGRNGTGDGEFIFPTDVAFITKGGQTRILVSEYGGNDRVSIFDSDGKFIRSFGTPGEGEGQFSRPAAIAVDAPRGVIYIADACNHRIAVYDLDCKLKGYIGAAGTQPGQMRYPYGLALRPGGDLAVCEFGNNRVQVLSPEGRSLRILGAAGRQLGQLAYPWALVVDGQKRAYVVDAGNNRVQIWQL